VDGWIMKLTGHWTLKLGELTRLGRNQLREPSPKGKGKRVQL